MKNVIKDSDEKLSTIIGKLSEAALKEGKEAKFETTLVDVSKLLTDNKINKPDISGDFFKTIETEEQWWENNKIFVGFASLVALSAFVFCSCFRFLDVRRLPAGYLLFFFGVIAILFIGLVVVALFMMKASAKHRAEKNERKNKMLAFRLKMLEAAFDLDNRKIIAEKHCMEKELSMKEKDYLYSLDEKQREDDHKRKVQLKRYEIIEEYMKHVVDLAKTGQVIDLQQILNIIGKEEQPAQNDNESNEDAESGDEKPDENKGNNTTEPPVAPPVPSDEEPAPGEDDHATVEEKTEADQAPEDVDPNHVEEPSDAKPEE